jgi:hypothetical protein
VSRLKKHPGMLARWNSMLPISAAAAGQLEQALREHPVALKRTLLTEWDARAKSKPLRLRCRGTRSALEGQPEPGASASMSCCDAWDGARAMSGRDWAEF